jgi:hypothetical protein
VFTLYFGKISSKENGRYSSSNSPSKVTKEKDSSEAKEAIDSSKI